MRTLKKVVIVGYLAYAAARSLGIRMAVGVWGGNEEHVALLGRTRDPGGIWVRRPYGDEALILFRGRGSRSPEAERDRGMVVGVAEAEHYDEQWGPILGNPTVIVSDPKP